MRIELKTKTDKFLFFLSILNCGSRIPKKMLGIILLLAFIAIMLSLAFDKKKVTKKTMKKRL